MTRAIAMLVLLAAACGDNLAAPPDAAPPADAGVDAPDDPFASQYDSPDDFPRRGCHAGALAGFDRAQLWPGLGLRTAVVGGELRTYTSDYLDEKLTPHTLTDDDLMIRISSFLPSINRWSLTVFDVCSVTADGWLHGFEAHCFEDSCGGTHEFNSEPFHWRTGEGESDGVTLVGEVHIPELEASGVPLDLAVDGDLAYVAMGTSGLRTVSLANAAAPALVGHYQPADNFFNDVSLVSAGGRRYAVMAGRPSEVVDVTSPASPQPVAPITVDAHTVAVEGTTAYFVDGVTARMWIYDLANPRAPVQRAIWQAPFGGEAGFHDVQVTGGIAYLATFYRGITIVDVHDPAAPALVGASPDDPTSRYWHSPWPTTVGGRKLVVNGDEGGRGLAVLDADPSSPTFLATVGSWGIPGDISMHDLVARGDKVYVVHYQHGVRVLDLADPAAPRQIGYFNTWRPADSIAAYYSGAMGIDIDPARRRIYVADSRRGLLVFSVTAALMP